MPRPGITCAAGAAADGAALRDSLLSPSTRAMLDSASSPGLRGAMEDNGDDHVVADLDHIRALDAELLKLEQNRSAMEDRLQVSPGIVGPGDGSQHRHWAVEGNTTIRP